MSAYSNPNNENETSFEISSISNNNTNLEQNPTTVNQDRESKVLRHQTEERRETLSKHNGTQLFKPRKTFESVSSESRSVELNSVESGENITEELVTSSSKLSFRQFKSQALGILAGAVVMFPIVVIPIVGMIAATHYFDGEVSDQEIAREELLQNPDAPKIELVRQKKLLTTLLVGTEVVALVAGIVAAFRVHQFVTNKISESEPEIDPQEIESPSLSKSHLERDFLQDIVEKARNSLDCDRVLIYSLKPNDYAMVVAESVADGYTQAWGKVIAETCFEAKYGDKYSDGRIQVIDNVAEAKIPTSDLEQFQELEIKANLVAPIVEQDQLFGFLVANQCSEPRQWQKTEIELLKQFAKRISFNLNNDKLLDDVSRLKTLTAKEREWTNHFTDIVQYIRQSLEQEDILNISVQEIRRVLKCDRVLVYSLNEDRYGTVIAESVVPGYTRALDKVISDSCFEKKYLAKYQDGRVRAIDNIYEADLSLCHLEQLEALDVRANLVIPILNQGNIFGLLVAHQCSAARHWEDYEIRCLTQIATQIGFTLDNAKMLSVAKEKDALAKREREWTNYFTDTVPYIRQSLQQKDILNVSVAEVRRVMKCDRVLVYSLNEDRYGTVVAESVASEYTKALNKVISDPCFEIRYLEKYRDGRVRALDNIYEAGLSSCYLEQLGVLEVKANLVTPILNEGKIFGLLVAHQCSAARHWEDYEIRWLTQIATQVGFALDNAKLLRELNSQNTLTQLLNRFILSIRQCIDRSELFKIAVEQVARGMLIDRVIVYQFDTDWNGTIVSESVVPGYPKSLNSQIQDPCFAQKYEAKYFQGYVKAISNIHEANLTECHLEKLESLAVKATIIAPIVQNEQLFGLLIGHQCAEIRDWEPSEIELFSQLTLQLGLALDRISLKEELFLKQNIPVNEAIQTQSDPNNFPKKISELQKISEVLVENQKTLQKIKVKIDNKSLDQSSLVDKIEENNHDSMNVSNDG